MKLSWGFFYLFLWVYRSAYSYLGTSFVAQFTSLGDSNRYSGGEVFDVTDIGDLGRSRFVATELTEAVGTLFALIFRGNIFLINVGFQTIAFVGIVVLLRSVEGKTRLILAGLLMLPSFSVWSSVASKESIVVLALGIISALVIDIYRNRARIRFVYLPAFATVYLFKEQYIPALLFLILGTIICSHVRRKTFLALVGGMASLVPLYLLRERLGELALAIPPNFLNLGSSRPAYWLETSDLLSKAPRGMFQSFFGPTIGEVENGFLQMLSFVESSAIVGVLLLMFVWRLPRLPAYMLFMGGFTLFWILFATYPLGIMNAGSAIRYRTGYEMLVFVAFVVLLSRDTFVVWRGWGGKNHPVVASAPSGATVRMNRTRPISTP